MKLTVIGTGYVGLVTGTCFAEMGNDVICVDNNHEKIDMLNAGKVPIWEPGLEDMIQRNVEGKRLQFTVDIKKAVEKSQICFIAVGTPPDEDGSADLRHVLSVAKDIANYMNDYKIVVNKSTVPVGTADRVGKQMNSVLSERGVKYPFDVVSNPEFLKEGAAIEDSMKPDRIIVGTENENVAKTMRELYAPFARSHDKLITMSIRSAEMTKYAANAMLASRISFMNEISKLCEKLGADVGEVRQGIGSDSRIGHKFIYPGIGYGGSCFPKDVKALIRMAKASQVEPKILTAIEDVNERQKSILVDKIKAHYGNDLSGKTFAVWGLAFKPQTDDMREAPSIVIINKLIEAGAKIKAYDPVAMKQAKKVFENIEAIEYCKGNYEALENADAILLVTEWFQFRYPDFNKMKALLKEPVLFDGRNQYNPTEMNELGFTYYSIGR
jgi:UDPglucose 6-dehydrogenase